MSKDWQAVADAINTRLAELDMTQAELASKSTVSPATLREIQHGVGKKRSPRTLAAISEALGWPSRHLDDVASGDAELGGQDRVSQLEASLAELTERVARIEQANGSD